LRQSGGCLAAGWGLVQVHPIGQAHQGRDGEESGTFPQKLRLNRVLGSRQE
jgi:hypothetical protein